MLLVLEMLLHQTPPLCIAANILTFANLIFLTRSIVKQLPSVNFVRDCQSVLVFFTKTLAAYSLAKIDAFCQLFCDGTSRRQVKIENAVVGYLSDKGFRTITLATDIIAVRGNGEGVRDAILRAFREGRSLLGVWRDCTLRMFPGQADLLALLPDPAGLCISKLGTAGGVTTNGASPARRFCRLFVAEVKKVCREKGYTPDQIVVFELDCWQHMSNVWFGTVIAHLSKYLTELMADDLNSFPSVLRMSTDIEDLLRCIEKTLGGTAQYAKGCGAMFME